MGPRSKNDTKMVNIHFRCSIGTSGEVANGWVDENGETHSYQNSNLSNAITIVASAYDAIQKFGSQGMLVVSNSVALEQCLEECIQQVRKRSQFTAGTGSGKSYGFQIGKLVAIVEQRLSGTLNKTHLFSFTLV